MLEIVHLSDSARRARYALAGEITADQLPRLEALFAPLIESGCDLSVDVGRVWRVDRAAVPLIARLTSSPGDRVHLVGVPHGLLEWLRTVSSEDA